MVPAFELKALQAPFNSKLCVLFVESRTTAASFPTHTASWTPTGPNDHIARNRAERRQEPQVKPPESTPQLFL